MLLCHETLLQGTLATLCSTACQEVRGNELPLELGPESAASFHEGFMVLLEATKVELITRPDIVCLDEPSEP